VAEFPVINQDKCNGCGLCVTVCHNNVLILVSNVITIIEIAECDWCADCEAVCSMGAIVCPYEVVIEEG
jgi:ferredoxin